MASAISARFGRVLAQLGGGVPAANAFALDAQLSIRATIRPEVFPYDTVAEQDTLGRADVTVVVPLHNNENEVLDALNSVYEQSLGALDLVVVDDCSTDRSLGSATVWANRNAARFNRIAVLKNRSSCGPASYRNAGFDAAETSYVLPLAADYRLLPHYCERLLNTIRSSRVGFVYGTIERPGDETSPVSAWPYDAQRLVGGNFIDGIVLVSKEAWATAGGYHHLEFGGEDYDFWCRIAERGLSGEWCTDVVAPSRVQQSSTLRTQESADRPHRQLVNDLASRDPWLAPVDHCGNSLSK